MKKAIWIAATAALALSGCGLLKKDEHGYPEIVKQNFIKSCTVQAAESDCACALAGIEKAISYDKFEAADQAAKANKPVDPAFERQMVSIVSQCRGGKPATHSASPEPAGATEDDAAADRAKGE